MKVFLGWSGDTSHKVASAFHDWLPSVIQAIKPYISSEDIAKGARWESEIAKELESTNFGIVCVTRENLTTAWINFEAGALSKTIGKSFVIPFLLEDIRPSEIQGTPLGQFQAVGNNKEGVRGLMKSINDVVEGQKLKKDTLEKSFEKWWPELEHKLEEIQKEEVTKPTPKKEGTPELLNRLLDEVATLQRQMGQVVDSFAERQGRVLADQWSMFKEFSDRVDALSAQVDPVGALASGKLGALAALSGTNESSPNRNSLANLERALIKKRVVLNPRPVTSKKPDDNGS